MADLTDDPTTRAPGRLGEVARVFRRLGCLGFGGPAVHIGLMEDELVRRRQWLSREQFLDMVGAVNLIPGPNSTEMTMHLGYHRAGWRGLLVGGVCFIIPAALITLVLAMLYQHYGTLPEVARWTRGIPAAILALIGWALWKLGQTAVKDRRCAILGVAAMLMVLGGIGEVLVIFAGGLIGMGWLRAAARADAWRTGGPAGWFAWAADPPGMTTPDLAGPGTPLAAGGAAAGVVGAVALAAAPNLTGLFLIFLKCGALLFGSGYVLVAFLENDLVLRTGWMTQAALLEAIAVGQITPGPLFTTATFVGQVLLGPLGALVATLGIFLPSFIFVALSLPWLPKLRQSPWTSALLDAVNVIALGLMAATLLRLGRDLTLAHWGHVVIALAGGLAIALRPRLNVSWLVLGGAVLSPLLTL